MTLTGGRDGCKPAERAPGQGVPLIPPFAVKANANDPEKKKLTETGVGQFGSGWAWLCLVGGKLTLQKPPTPRPWPPRPGWGRS